MCRSTDILHGALPAWSFSSLFADDTGASTHTALLAYPLLQSAACLSLSNTNTYCYVSSIAGGASHASDIYLYSLPLGIRFPDSGQLSSGAYEKDMLGVFGGSLGSSASSKTKHRLAT
ncbi:hypothetical protein VKT23_011928 [Stygiomarasmius scandens]|uniref:DUF7729 domain-containing protein n=1 Tax=Marasmiellus scandens TaxID=2682957 RepID=A0ABR1J7D0_9AGAR